MDLNDLRSVITVISLLIFTGILAWTWWPRRGAEFDAAARLPFEEDAPRAAAPGRPKQGPTLSEGRSTYSASGELS
jgi:cytochrome c oxidase cbb3-type subunit 4